MPGAFRLKPGGFKLPETYGFRSPLKTVFYCCPRYFDYDDDDEQVERKMRMRMTSAITITTTVTTTSTTANKTSTTAATCGL